ncbi:MAG: helix-hairpin-helix domain-containing protein [Candidatus Margulisiibacteriota bacterium]
MNNKETALKMFRTIPGVGKKMSNHFWDMGLRSLDDLKKKDPEELYFRMCAYQQTEVDRCVLYVFRCAVYYVSEKDHDPYLLKWWNWKDK